MSRQIGKVVIKMYNRHEMMELVVVDGKARGIIARNLVTGEIERHSAHAVVVLPVVMVTFISFLQMQWDLTFLLHGKFTKRSVLRNLATFRFTYLYSGSRNTAV
jgi:hypothetical protein